MLFPAALLCESFLVVCLLTTLLPAVSRKRRGLHTSQRTHGPPGGPGADLRVCSLSREIKLLKVAEKASWQSGCRVCDMSEVAVAAAAAAALGCLLWSQFTFHPEMCGARTRHLTQSPTVREQQRVSGRVRSLLSVISD